MKVKGKETFKDELCEVIEIELTDPNNHTLEDVVNVLMKHYNVECRVKGNTISYRHPNFTDKSGKLASVRGSKLGEKYTVKGIGHELREKQRGRSADRIEGVLLTGEAETRCTADSQPVESRIYIKATGSEGTSGNVNAGVRSDQSDDTGFGTAIGRNIRGSQEGRASALARSSDTSNVPTLEELFSSYQRRNGKDSRKRTPEKAFKEVGKYLSDTSDEMEKSIYACTAEVRKATKSAVRSVERLLRIKTIGDLLYHSAPLLVLIDIILRVIALAAQIS